MKRKLSRRLDDICELIARVKHGEHTEEYRNRFIKHYYRGRLYQCRNLIRDHVFPSEYKVIDYAGEFGPELKYVVPFAYWHHWNGTLKRTIAAKHTRHFYFFSTDHEEQYESRRWRPYVSGIPNSEDHNVKYNFSQWKQVPFKDRYRNDILKFAKPILVIANKYNIEWAGPPVNYLSTDLLRWIFDSYGARYQIIYNRPGGSNIVNDDSDVLDLGDHEMIRHEYPHILNMSELYREVKSAAIESYNHFQLLLYANTNRFVSVHGGASVLASYFKGVNVIYSVKGHEHYFNEFENFYPRLSGARILNAKSNADVMEFMKKYY